MSLVPGSRFPSYPHQGPEYYPPKHMGAVHASVLVTMNSTPAVVVTDLDDYSSFVNVNLAGGSVAGSAVAYSNLPDGGLYSYGASIAAGATLGAIGSSSSAVNGIEFEYLAYVTVVDTADTAAEQVLLSSYSSLLQAYVGAAAGANEAFSGTVFDTIGIYTSNDSVPILYNHVATTANCTVYLSLLLISLYDYVPGPKTARETW